MISDTSAHAKCSVPGLCNKFCYITLHVLLSVTMPCNFSFCPLPLQYLKLITFKTRKMNRKNEKTEKERRLTTSITGISSTVSLLMAVVLKICILYISSLGATITWSRHVHRVLLEQLVGEDLAGVLLSVLMAVPQEYPVPELSLARFILRDRYDKWLKKENSIEVETSSE